MDSRSPPSFLRSFSIARPQGRELRRHLAIASNSRASFIVSSLDPVRQRPCSTIDRFGSVASPLVTHTPLTDIDRQRGPDCLPMAFRLVAAQHNRGMLSLAGSMASLRDVSWIPEQPRSTNLPGSMQRCAGHPGRLQTCRAAGLSPHLRAFATVAYAH